MFRDRKLKGNYGTRSFKRSGKRSVVEELLGKDIAVDAAPEQAPPPPPFQHDRGLSNEGAVSDQDSLDVELAEDDQWYDCESEDEVPETSQPKQSFDNIRKRMVDYYTLYARDVHEQVSSLPQAEKTLFETVLQQGGCRCQDPACRGGTEVVNPSPFSAYVITMSGCHLVQLPVLRCRTCSVHFQPNPLQLGCLPGNVNAYEPRISQTPVLWFHMSLLQQIDSLQYFAKMSAMYSTAKALHDVWEFLQPLSGQAQQVCSWCISYCTLRARHVCISYNPKIAAY